MFLAADQIDSLVEVLFDVEAVENDCRLRKLVGDGASAVPATHEWWPRSPVSGQTHQKSPSAY